MRLLRMAVCLFVLAAGVSTDEALLAAINSGGDLNTIPPVGGGPVAGALIIGDDDLGFMHIADGTALTNGGPTTIGNDATAIGLVTMSGVESDWTMTSGSANMTVGDSGTGSITLSDLARMEVGANTILGDAASGVGEINIYDFGTLWRTDSVTVGQSGRGVVNIGLGGRLDSGSSIVGNGISSDGLVTIADPLSQWRITGGITVGASGSGRVYLLDGGGLRTTASSVIGTSLNTVGLVEVNGVGSLWNSAGNNNVTIGSTGTGKLHVFNGARTSIGGNVLLSSTTGSLGEVWVDGLGSALNIAFQLSTGVSEAQITVSNGGVITATSFQLETLGRMTLNGGRLEVTSGTLNNRGLVHGSGTIETNSFVNQSGNTRGRLRVDPSEHLIITGNLNNSGFVEVNGGELEILGTSTHDNLFDIEARNGAILRFGGLGLRNETNTAQLAITGGEVDIFGNVTNTQVAEIVVGNQSSVVFHDTLTNNGDLFVLPGSSLFAVEQLNLLGSPSNLNVQLSALDAGEETYPLEAGGLMILEGDLTVTLADGYAPVEGDVFPLLIAGGGRAGIFSDENLPALSAGLGWETLYTPNSLSLSVVATGSGQPGDFDNDGDVDGRDFLAWQRNPAVGDLADWQANYGSGSLVATSVAVPEPGTISLALIALFGFLRKKH